jgi:cytochrome c biogenesis protein CcmG/thiol:disulfide interchange protein DsbE
MRPRTRLVTLAAVVLALGLAAAPALASVPERETSTRVRLPDGKLPAAEDLGTPDDPAIGKAAPPIVGQGFDGQKVTFASDGTPRIVLFLAHSCPHCQAEVPRIVELAESGKLDGVQIDTVTTNTSKSQPNYPPSKWLSDEDWPFSPVLLDDKKLRAFFGYGGDAFPYFVFVGADGLVKARITGELGKEALAEIASRLVAGESLFEEQ